MVGARAERKAEEGGASQTICMQLACECGLYVAA